MANKPSSILEIQINRMRKAFVQEHGALTPMREWAYKSGTDGITYFLITPLHAEQPSPDTFRERGISLNA